jgi:nucleoside 2-deoxyribosyltransferase
MGVPGADLAQGSRSHCRVFLGGPMQYLNSHDNSPTVVASHRAIVRTLVDAGCEVLSAHEAEAYGDDSEQFAPAAVTVRDFGWATACDVYVAVLPTDTEGRPYRSDGTHVEIGWATALGKRVILVLDDRAEPPYSHLVLGLVANGKAERISISNWRDELVRCLLGERPVTAVGSDHAVQLI